MKDNQAKYPQLRFKGFTDPWEQRKLNNYLDVSKEKNKNNYYSKDEVLSVSGKVGIVNQIAFKGRSFAGASVAPYRVVHNGDVVYTKSPLSRNPFGIIKTNKGKTGIVSTLYAVYKPISNLTNTEFVQSYFELDLRMNKYMKPLVNIGAKHDMKVSDANALLGEVVFPSFEEQSKITKFLGQLDNFITLHQRKLAKLKELKQGYLQKLFPKNGSKFPQLRFAGFADAWEQRKLSDIATLNARIGWQNLRTSEFLESGDYMLITGTNFHDGTVDYSTVHYVEKNRYEQDTKIQVENGSILITKDGTLGKVALVQGLNMPATLNAGVFNVKIKDPETIDVDYVYQYLAAPFLMKYANAKSTGGTIKHLNQNILIDFPVLLPRKREQVKLAELLNGLDNTITLHQRKLEKLQELKKGYLQKMFC